jgi:hypothetical protein
MTAVDAWTVVHALSGAVLAHAGVRPGPALAMLVGFEVFEAWARKVRLGGAFGEPESGENITVDILAGIVGYLTAWQTSRDR